LKGLGCFGEELHRLRQSQEPGFRENCDKVSGFIKCGKFVTKRRENKLKKTFTS
jgi:hypothetical protein